MKFLINGRIVKIKPFKVEKVGTFTRRAFYNVEDKTEVKEHFVGNKERPFRKMRHIWNRA